MSHRLKLALIILDGLGLNPNSKENAVFHAQAPVLERLFAMKSKTQLLTFGEHVGLPEGQMGNSEVGHLNIGGGRVVKQELTKINEAVKSKALSSNAVCEKLFCLVNKDPNSCFHLIVLLSKGGVHSHVTHVRAVIDAAIGCGVKRIAIHAIADGRDCPPAAAREELSEFLNFIEQRKAENPELELGVATIIGRYWAMDRDSRWERTELFYRLLTELEGENTQEPLSLIEKRYEGEEFDEFLKPIVVSGNNFSRSPAISGEDAVLFCNFRADRMRQIVSAFFPDFCAFNRRVLVEPAGFSTLTEYHKDYKVDVVFAAQKVKQHFGAVLSENALSQLRIAETEKYPHVTYFFNGGVEEAEIGEERILIPSPRDVPTYDEKPQMSAGQVTEALIEAIRSNKFDVCIVNYANCDMVGHTGDFNAAKQAVEAVDKCLAEVLEVIEEQGATAFITADHGNSEQMLDYDTGQPHTFHTLYPVPFVVFGKHAEGLELRESGALCDIAPTALSLLGLLQPEEMTGISLIVEPKRQ